MAIFKIKEVDGSAAMVVRASCISCVRNVAARSSPQKVEIWRDPTKSTIELLRETGKNEVLLIGEEYDDE